MPFRPEEVSAILQKELEGFKSRVDVESVGSVLQVGWNPGDVRLVPGEEYAIEIRRASGGSFKIHRIAGEANPRGNFVLDEKEVVIVVPRAT